jgi:hypothetical protein
LGEDASGYREGKAFAARIKGVFEVAMSKGI